MKRKETDKSTRFMDNNKSDKFNSIKLGFCTSYPISKNQNQNSNNWTLQLKQDNVLQEQGEIRIIRTGEGKGEQCSLLMFLGTRCEIWRIRF